MGTAGYLLASATPLLLLGARALAVRGLSAGHRLTLDLALLLVSIPIGIWLIGWILRFPVDVGDHSPGIGVAFISLVLIWALCVLVWLARLVWLALRKFESPG